MYDNILKNVRLAKKSFEFDSKRIILHLIKIIVRFI